jgi:hypothetical protein
MKNRRRDVDTFSLSFLDCICCGFGAIILLFVLSTFAEPVVIEELTKHLKARVLQLEEELTVMRGEARVFNRDLTTRQAQLSEEKVGLARLQGDLSDLLGQHAATRDKARVQNIIEGKLARARQELTDEMRRLLSRAPPPRDDSSVGGIPVDSEYIIFIIDTSGSMQRYSWGMVQQKIRETLQVYPKVKGIQVMNDMGSYMFPQYQGRWIPDSPARRRAIVFSLSTWRAFSNSSPVEGITTAINTFYAADKKISLYVFGDEFSGSRLQPVVDAIDRINHVGRDGNRRVRIHAVGFPVIMDKTDQLGNTGQRFATLMRILCRRNGGTFVGLNSTLP